MQVKDFNIMNSEQLIKLMEHFSLSTVSFANDLHLPAATISNIKNGKCKASVEVIEKIKNRYPELSAEWLLFGTGEMIHNSISDNQKKTTFEIQKKTDNSTRDSKNRNLGQTEISFDSEPKKNNDASSITNIIAPSNPNVTITQDTRECKQNKTIEKIIIYYSDKTFDEYSVNIVK